MNFKSQKIVHQYVHICYCRNACLPLVFPFSQMIFCLNQPLGLRRFLRFLKKNKNISYPRAREFNVQKLKCVAPDLKLGVHSLRASGATSAANATGVSDRCLKRH